MSSRPSKIAIVKELGARSPRCLAAHAVRGGDEPELVVVERYPAALGADVLAILEEDTKELASLEHTNIATIIASVKLKGDVAVLSEWVDGESLESVLASPQKPSLEVLLRIVTDVLAGLSALHASGEGRVCGALGSDDVFVGVDGVTRIARFGLGRVPAGALAPRRIASMSPEFLRGERAVRGDVFTAGTLLWECFTGERLFAAPASVEAHLERLASKPPRVDVSKREAWASGLADVIERALAIDPAARWASASELSRAIASAAPSKVASRGNVSQYVARAFGERIEGRVAKLEPKVSSSLSSMAPPTTTPPPAVEVTPAAKLPDVVMPEVKPAQPAAKPEPITKPVEVAAAKPPEVAAKAPLKPEAAKPAAQKNVPLPKRMPSQPDSAPRLVQAPASAPEIVAAKPVAGAKTNGSAPRAVTSAKAAVAAPAPVPKKAEPRSAPLPKPSEPKPSEPKPSEPKLESQPKVVKVEPAPESIRDELDVDIDLASVRPPPAAPPKPPSPKPPVVTAPRAVVAESPAAPPKPVPAVAAPTVAEDVDPSQYARRSPYRGPLLVLGGLVLLGGGFAAGRLTAPDPWPATPPITMPATATSATATASELPPRPLETTTASAATQATASSTASVASTASTAPSVASPSEGARTTSPTTTGWTAPTAAKPDASSRRYDPGGI